MNDNSLRNIEWASEEFFDILMQANHAEKVAEDKRRIEAMLDDMQTDEGWRYLIERLTP